MILAWDLTIAIIVIAVLSVSAYLAGRNLSSRANYSPLLLFGGSLAFCLVFSWLYSGDLVWANAIPLSGVVYWSNFMPILLGFAAGVASNTPGLISWRRKFTVGTFSLIAISYLLIPIGRPIVSPAVTQQAQWSDGICLQSHDATCAAAAAATLLNLNGIRADEREMVDSCLTSEHGTESLGLYRGLTLASQTRDRKAQVASSNPSHWLSSSQLPNIALVEFDAVVPSNSRRWLGPRGEGHAVVILGHEDGRWLVGDPAIGRITWSDEELRGRFTGEAIYLMRR